MEKEAPSSDRFDPLTTITERLNLLVAWTVALLNQAIEACAAAHASKMSELGQPIRVAITCEPLSSAIDAAQSVVGHDRTLGRLDHAINFIEERVLSGHAV